MDRFQAVEGIRRMAAAAGGALMDESSKALYLDEVMRQFGRLSHADWASVVDWVVRHRKTRGLPTVAELEAAIKAVRIGGFDAALTCRTCRGVRFSEIYVKNIMSGEVFQAASPCRVCNTGLVEKIPEGYVKVDAGSNPDVIRARQLSPAGARAAIAKLDSGRAKIGEEVMLALVQRSVEPERPGDPPIRSLSSVISEIMSCLPPNAP